MKEKILILGTGNAQVDFIKLCKENGLFVYACSYKSEGRGINLADYFELIDVTDEHLIKKFVNKHKIRYIYSIGTDVAMPVIAKVSEELSLNHFVSYSTAQTCNNKALLRSEMGQLKNGIYNIKFREVLQLSDTKKWDIFPAIIKPTDNQGQRGVRKILSKEDIPQALEIALNNSSSKTAIIEEFVEGFEISVNSYIVDGDFLLFFITERNSFENYPGGIIKSHKYPVERNFEYNKVITLVRDVCEKLNIKNGPVYFQIMINNAGNPILIEGTSRFDGCHLWNLINKTIGIDLLTLTLNHLENKPIDKSIYSKKTVNTNLKAELSFFTQAPGTYMNTEYHIISEKSIFVEWFYEDGEIIRPINNYQEKVGYEIIIDNLK